ncbi:MATE family efflux transporter [Novosphingobium sp. ZN18A2]|uniref:MATE family efflux transporter n=1 Tax=Novosphingobium sp. ZN18A2 TaxID=3079861 RepID=UPI0030CFF28F
MTRSGPPARGDLNSGPVMRTLLVFSAPTLASNILQSLNGSVNSVWVGRLLGEDALAATANANVVMFLVFAAVFGFGMAATVKVGQAFGAGRVDAARRTFGSAMGFCSLLAVIIAVAGWILADPLLKALATPGDAYDLALTYLRVIFIAMPASMISVMFAMSLRGAGDSRTPLLFMLLSVGLDIVFNPMLITGFGPFPRLGIAGSALSTALASVVSMIAMVTYVYVKDIPLRLRGSEVSYLLPRRDELGYIVTKGLPMGAQMLLISAAGIIMVGLVNREGILASAAYGASLQLWTYLQMPAMAISAAVSAMAAQAIGARLTGRLSEITRAGIILNMAMTGALTALLLLFDRAALELFLGPGSPAVPLARHIQLLASWSFLLFGVTIVLFGTMRAGGVVIAPLIVLAIAMYPGRLGFYYIAYPRIGQDALWYAFPVGSVIASALAIVAYRMPGWRKDMHAIPSGEAAEEAMADSDVSGRMEPLM